MHSVRVAVIHEDGQTEFGEASNFFFNYLAKALINVLAIPYTRLKLNPHKKRNTYMLDCTVTTDKIIFDVILTVNHR